MRSPLLALVAIGLIAASACDGDRQSPLAPQGAGNAAMLPPALNLPAPTEITIGGQPSVDHPGESVQLTATARYDGGTTMDVTDQVVWQAGENVRISSSGFVTALRYGESNIRASLATQPRRSAQVRFRVAPAGAFLVQVVLRTTSGVPVAQTVVEAQSSAGVLQATTDDYGWCIVAAMADTLVRVEKEGFRPVTQQLIVNGDHRVDLELQRTATGGPSGRYRLTLAAASGCVLPAEAKRRTYDALVEDIDQRLVVLASGANFVTWGSEPGFAGSRQGDAVQFWLTDSLHEQYNLIERIPGVGDLHYAGVATGTIGERMIVAALNGVLTLDSGWKTCRADNHRLELVRMD